jgi:pyrimidine operon attenuation protein / uracil phosphoribosyltransferase
MIDERTCLLTDTQISHRINRIAYQIFEDHFTEKEIILAGIVKNGDTLSKKIASVLESISSLKIIFCPVKLEKHNPGNTEVTIPLKPAELEGKCIVVIDDVLNSGRTMFLAFKPFLQTEVKKLRTAVLIDRSHRNFPVTPDFVGLSLATTLQEHITVDFDGEATAWLS